MGASEGGALAQVSQLEELVAQLRAQGSRTDSLQQERQALQRAVDDLSAAKEQCSGLPPPACRQCGGFGMGGRCAWHCRIVPFFECFLCCY